MFFAVVSNEKFKNSKISYSFMIIKAKFGCGVF